MIDKADTYCGKCIKSDVCGMECVYDPATTYCAYRVEARPHGEWIYKKFDEKTGISDSYFCSHCNFPLTGIYNSYCGVCGADMRQQKGGKVE